MWPIVSGLLSGGASLLGSIFSSDTAAKNTQQQIQAQQGMQLQAEQYNTQMSSTAYQRASSDMKAAGLNPMMMFGSGGPASSPTIAPQQVPMSQSRGALSDIGANVRQGLDSMVSAKTMEKMTEEMANLETTRKLVEAEVPLVKQRTETEAQETSRRKSVAEQEAFNVPGSAFQAQRYKSLLGLPQGAVDFMERGGYLTSGAAKLMDPFTSFISGARGARDVLRPLGRRSTEETTDSRTGESTFRERFNY